jgi:hypothetical protein
MGDCSKIDRRGSGIEKGEKRPAGMRKEVDRVVNVVMERSVAGRMFGVIQVLNIMQSMGDGGFAGQGRKRRCLGRLRV